MRLSYFNEGDKVLLVGEGNFSFSTDLLRHNLKIHLTATCYESLPISEAAIENIEFLKNNGVCVLLGVDATCLLDNSQLNTSCFNKIIFNFPHCLSKMRLDKNRELLQKFFQSIDKLLHANGRIFVTLCNGQGGTNFDCPQRKWSDSWKIKEMAAHANFILTSVEPFVEANFANYRSTGYRGQDKYFHLNQALTHTFVQSKAPTVDDFIPISSLDNFENNLSTLEWSDIRAERPHNEVFGPPTFDFDITFIVNTSFVQHNFYIFLYNTMGRIIKNVELIRSYVFPATNVISKTYRISYQSDELPLYRKRVIEIHENVLPSVVGARFDVKFSR